MPGQFNSYEEKINTKINLKMPMTKTIDMKIDFINRVY
jgi:hypothetical protein